MIKVEGLADLEKTLFALGSTSTARRGGQRALMEAAKPMVQEIAQLAPKDEMNLAQSIKAQPSNRNRREDTAEVVIGIAGWVKPAVTIARAGQGGDGRAERIALGVSGYGPMQEFGTEKMQANPFFRPGFDATAEQVIRLVGVTLGPEIQKSARRLSGKQARGR